jgi:hypothetical protein
MNYQDIQSQERYADRLQAQAGYGNAISGGQGLYAEQKRQSGVQRELQQMEKNLSALHTVIDMLNERLSFINIPSPETVSSRGMDISSGSAMTHQLSSFNSMLAEQVRRLESLNQGIDL